MRRTALMLAAGVFPLGGCHLAQVSLHNLVNEPTTYLDERNVQRQLRAEAKAALVELEGRRGGCSEDYRDGFLDGYPDYLERGGNAVPPAVPPIKYRRGRFLNPEGHARIHDYFAGFQAGADVAAQSGKRQFLTVPVLLPEPVPEPPVNVRILPPDQCDPARAADPPRRAGEPLPSPRGMDPATGLPVPARPPVEPAAKPDLPKIDTPPADKPKADGPRATDLPLPIIPTPTPPDLPKKMPNDGSRSPASLELPPPPGDDHPGTGRTLVPPLADLPRKPGLSN